MEKDFIIDQVSWHTQAKRNYDFDVELCYLTFKSIINYLQSNGLTTRIILTEEESVNEDTCIKMSDLTKDGFMLVKKCYDRWAGKTMDKAIEPTNYKMLDNALKKIRSGSTN